MCLVTKERAEARPSHGRAWRMGARLGPPRRRADPAPPPALISAHSPVLPAQSPLREGNLGSSQLRKACSDRVCM